MVRELSGDIIHRCSQPIAALNLTLFDRAQVLDRASSQPDLLRPSLYILTDDASDMAGQPRVTSRQWRSMTAAPLVPHRDTLSNRITLCTVLIVELKLVST